MKVNTMKNTYVIRENVLSFIRKEMSKHKYNNPWSVEFKDLCCTLLKSNEFGDSIHQREVKLANIFYNYSLSKNSGLFDSRYTDRISSMVKYWTLSEESKWNSTNIFLCEGEIISKGELKTLSIEDLKDLQSRIYCEIKRREDLEKEQTFMKNIDDKVLIELAKERGLTVIKVLS